MKFRIYYYTNKEYCMDIEAETEEDAIKEVKEYWSDGDELSEGLDEDAPMEIERNYP